MPRLVAGADGHEARSGSTGPERRPSTSSGPRSTLDEDPPACRGQQRRTLAQTVSTKAAPTSTMTPLWPGLLQRPTKHRRTLELASRGPRRHRHRCPRLIRALRRHRLGIYLAWRVRRREPRPPRRLHSPPDRADTPGGRADLASAVAPAAHLRGPRQARTQCAAIVATASMACRISPSPRRRAGFRKRPHEVSFL